MSNLHEEMFGYVINRDNPGWRWLLAMMVIGRPYWIIRSWIRYKLFKRNNSYLIAKEARRHHGEICLDYNYEPVKLLGWTDGEDDYYWVLQPMAMRAPQNGQTFYLSSCVSSPMWLKWNLNPWYYRLMENVFYLNSLPEADIRKDLQTRGIVLQ